MAPGVILCRSDEDVAIWRIPRPADGPPVKAVTLPSAELERCIERYSAEWGASLSLKLASELEAVLAPASELAQHWPQWANELRTAQDASRLEVSRGAEFLDGLLQSPTQRAIDALCPVGHGTVLATFERGQLHTFALAVRGPKGVQSFQGPDVIRSYYHAGREQWRKEATRLLSVVERQVCPVAAACFCEQSTLVRLIQDPQPGLLSLKVASRDVILHPNNAAWAAVLGADVGTAVLDKAASLASGFLGAKMPSSWLSSVRDVANPLLSTAMDTAKNSAALAFQPLVTSIAPAYGIHRWLLAKQER